MRFFIEQVAICPPNRAAAIELLKFLGLTDWVDDLVTASGTVHGDKGCNVASLAFNYQASRGFDGSGADERKPLELEVLSYNVGPNWMDKNPPSVSHFGMHCSEEELAEWRKKFKAAGIDVAQEVNTQTHLNPAIAGTRWYKYVIFDTRPVLGVDLKFIVRLPERRAS